LIALGIQLNFHFLAGGGALTVSRSYSGNWSVTFTGRLGFGFYLGANVLTGVGATGPVSVGAGAEFAYGLRSVGGSAAIGQGAAVYRGAYGIGYGGYIGIEGSINPFWR